MKINLSGEYATAILQAKGEIGLVGVELETAAEEFFVTYKGTSRVVKIVEGEIVMKPVKERKECE